MDRRMIATLYRRAGAGRWGLSEEDFARAIDRSVAGRFPENDPPEPRAVAEYVGTLRLDDLALAAACEQGSAPAWEHFVEHHRPIVRRAAHACLRDESRARELADSLWADLWGLVERDGRRRSLLAYFHGRSSLSGWLRALVARRHVDLRRAERRSEPLDERADPPADGNTPPLDGADPSRRALAVLFQQALASVLAALDPGDRLRLSLYYLRGLTLAESGRILGEHESSVSRKLDRTRRRIRREVERQLRRHGLDDAQITLCYEHAETDLLHDLDSVLDDARNTAVNVPELVKPTPRVDRNRA